MGRELASPEASKDPVAAGASTAGRATFVPLTAPGDRVRVRLLREKERVAWGEVETLLAPSSSRVPPRCPVFDRCGGCQWRHVEPAVQKQAKGEIVARALGVPEVALVSPVPQDGYRERARLHLGSDGRLGFLARREHALVSLDRCPQLSPALERVLVALTTFVKGLPRDRLQGATIDLQEGREGVHLAWRLPRGAGFAAEDLWSSTVRGAGAVGVVLGGAGASDASVAVNAGSGLPDVDVAEPGSLPLRIPAGAFAQVSRTANAALVQAVLAGVGAAPGHVRELYAGSGNFTRHLVPRASRLDASDGDADAVRRGQRNAPGARWSAGPPSPDGRDVPDVVVLDPPRAGADDLHLAAARWARRTVVYVSCDPQTLGRDARELVRAGFVLAGATAFDLMPETFHVETVAIFQRAI